jgi:hypothetical protein
MQFEKLPLQQGSHVRMQFGILPLQQGNSRRVHAVWYPATACDCRIRLLGQKRMFYLKHPFLT